MAASKGTDAVGDRPPVSPIVKPEPSVAPKSPTDSMMSPVTRMLSRRGPRHDAHGAGAALASAADRLTHPHSWAGAHMHLVAASTDSSAVAGDEATGGGRGAGGGVGDAARVGAASDAGSGSGGSPSADSGRGGAADAGGARGPAHGEGPTDGGGAPPAGAGMPTLTPASHRAVYGQPPLPFALGHASTALSSPDAPKATGAASTFSPPVGSGDASGDARPGSSPVLDLLTGGGAAGGSASSSSKGVSPPPLPPAARSPVKRGADAPRPSAKRANIGGTATAAPASASAEAAAVTSPDAGKTGGSHADSAGGADAGAAERIILGSSSQWRRTVMRELGLEHSAMDPNIDEKAVRHPDPLQLPVCVAKAKAAALLSRIDRSAPGLLITADQVVHFQGTVREKPADAAEAVRFIMSYAKVPAETVAALVVCDIQSGEMTSGIDIARVHFSPDMPESAAVAAAAGGKGDCMTCCGSLCIEDPALEPHITRIEGTRDSVFGLPRALLLRLLSEARKRRTAEIGAGAVA